MSTRSRLVYRVWALVFAALLAAGAVACGDDGAAPAVSPTPTEAGASPTPAPTTPSPTPTVAPTPTPSPTPMVEPVPEGWERHTTASFQIDLPKTWMASDLTEETLQAIRETLWNLNPEAASRLEGVTAADFDFLAVYAESAQVIHDLTIFHSESPVPIRVSEVIAAAETGEAAAELAAQGMTVLATDSTLTIGGSPAGSIQTSAALGPFEIRQVRYLVQAKPTVIFSLVFATGADSFPALESVFEEIAQSFRVLEAS